MRRRNISFSVFLHLLWLDKYVLRKKTGKLGRCGSASKEKVYLFSSSSGRKKQEKKVQILTSTVLIYFFNLNGNSRHRCASERSWDLYESVLQISPEQFYHQHNYPPGGISVRTTASELTWSHVVCISYCDSQRGCSPPGEGFSWPAICLRASRSTPVLGGSPFTKVGVQPPNVPVST